jgi:hypothetical protein
MQSKVPASVHLQQKMFKAIYDGPLLCSANNGQLRPAAVCGWPNQRQPATVLGAAAACVGAGHSDRQQNLQPRRLWQRGVLAAQHGAVSGSRQRSGLPPGAAATAAVRSRRLAAEPGIRRRCGCARLRRRKCACGCHPHNGSALAELEPLPHVVGCQFLRLLRSNVPVRPRPGIGCGLVSFPASQASMRLSLQALWITPTARPAARAGRPQTTTTTCWRLPSLPWRCPPSAHLTQRVLCPCFELQSLCCTLNMQGCTAVSSALTLSACGKPLTRRHVTPPTSTLRLWCHLQDKDLSDDMSSPSLSNQKVMVSSPGQGQQAAAEEVVHAAQG